MARAARAPVVVQCVDGPAAMGDDEFERLLDAGNVLRHLVRGHHEMLPQYEDLDVFRRYGVTRRTLGLVRACVRDGALPRDAAAYDAVAMGTLREQADALGGFADVDQALHEGEPRPQIPAADVAGAYEWRTLFVVDGKVADAASTPVQDANDALQAEGFLLVSQTVDLCGSVGKALVFRRRARG
jgi:hypothetical protein